MKVGKVYKYKENSGRYLTCGSGYYPYAVCVLTNPLVLVSEHGDMLWNHAEEEYLVEVNVKLDTTKAFERLKRENYDCVIIREEF
jgi:hypothetical protein